MINTERVNKKDVLNAAKRVIKETRPEEIELMDDVELGIYNKAKEIIQEYYSKKRSSR